MREFADIRVVHLNYTDTFGGAGWAAYRLHKGLLSIGVHSSMVVSKKHSKDECVFPISDTFVGECVRRLSVLSEVAIVKFYNRNNPNGGFDPSVFRIPIDSHEAIKNADIVHLHWINNALAAPETLHKIAQQGKKVVWTLHDMWPFTGGCHYAGSCTRYDIGCGKCPLLESAKEGDVSRILINRKRKYYPEDIIAVSPSAWLAECAKKSLLFQNKEVRHIPNGVDVNIFKPSAQMEARAFFGLPMDRPIVLFGAVSMNDPRKGLRFLDEALQSLRASGVMGSILLVRFGSIFKENLNVGATVVDIGNIREQEKLALLYAAADIFVASSLEDNLPNTLLESLACGTPVVGFRIGGFPEIIDHNINGYLAEPRNSEDLASGIAKTFATVKSDSEMRKQSRKKIEEKFSLKRQAEAYSKLYQELLDQQ